MADLEEKQTTEVKSVEAKDFTVEVKFLETELREKDEIDKNAFTMYQLSVTKRVGGQVESEWELYRRYSQFFQLNTELDQSFPESKGLAFPPKQTMGNLVASFVNARKASLQTWTSALLELPGATGITEIVAFFEARTGLMQKGCHSPALKLTDLPGREVDTKHYDDHIIIYSAASRYNFSKLKQALAPAMTAMIAKYPQLKYITVTVADMREVPDKFMSMVGPILKSVDSKNRVVSQTGYITSAGAAGCFDRSRMFFIPDYSGDTLAQLGFEDANWTFRLSVVYQGTVQCSLQSSSKNFTETFRTTIDDLVKGSPALISKELEAKGGDTKLTNEERASIPAGGKVDAKVSVDSETTWLAWDFYVRGGEHVEFGMFYISDGKEEVRVPMAVVKAKEAVHARGGWKVAGKPGQYVLRWGNSMSYWSSKDLRYKVILA